MDLSRGIHIKKNHWLTREDPQSISIQSAGLRKKLIRKHLVFPLERSCLSLETMLNECVRQQKQTNRADKAAKDVLVTSPSFYITQWINMPVVAARNDNAVIRDTISLLLKNCKLLVSLQNLFSRFPALKMVFYLLWDKTGDKLPPNKSVHVNIWTKHHWHIICGFEVTSFCLTG